MAQTGRDTAKARRSFGDRALTARLVAAERLRRLRMGLREWPSRRMRYAGRSPDELLRAIPDLRIADPVAAEQIYSGVFSFAGRVLHTSAGNVFDLDAPSPAFAAELSGFGWLRHLAADNSELASANARALVGNWLSVHGERPAGPAWEPGVTARRLMAFLCHGSLPLRGAELQFYKSFLRTIGLHQRYLAAQLPYVRDGKTRILCHAALTAARIATPSSRSGFHSALKRLAEEADRQIHADGGPVDRNPETLKTLLFDLCAIKIAITEEGLKVPDKLMGAIDRMFAALSFFRHADGELALFNGVGAIVADEINALFRHDDTKASTPERMPHTGYERLAAQGAILIADTGAPPPRREGRDAHAGTLAFEMSSGRHRYIVNSGVDRIGPAAYRQISRQTVAHSTLTLDDTSSTRHVGTAAAERLLGWPVTQPPEHVISRRIESENGNGFEASHDGYVGRFGYEHHRRIVMAANGNRIAGTDRLEAAGKGPREGVTATIRFHLHPAIHVILDGNGDLMLMADSDDSWVLRSDGPEPLLGESFFFAMIGGATRSKVITISFDPATTPIVNWQLLRTGLARRI